MTEGEEKKFIEDSLEIAIRLSGILHREILSMHEKFHHIGKSDLDILIAEILFQFSQDIRIKT